MAHNLMVYAKINKREILAHKLRIVLPDLDERNAFIEHIAESAENIVTPNQMAECIVIALVKALGNDVTKVKMSGITRRIHELPWRVIDAMVSEMHKGFLSITIEHWYSQSARIISNLVKEHRKSQSI